ncbi:hypothetical protein K1719_027582 [Acacia pycnantha]|nr:hypothetical protein K1719_027582 [Acacia pycnantha]
MSSMNRQKNDQNRGFPPHKWIEIQDQNHRSNKQHTSISGTHDENRSENFYLKTESLSHNKSTKPEPKLQRAEAETIGKNEAENSTEAENNNEAEKKQNQKQRGNQNLDELRWRRSPAQQRFH